MAELSEVSRGHSTRNGKDRTIGGFQSLKYTKKCDKSRQLPSGGYLCKDRVELKSSTGAHSISSMCQSKENDGDEYASKLLEKILDRNNLNLAYKRVKANKGSHGVDGMNVDELLPFLKQNGELIKQSILEGTYHPKPVRRVEIPKSDGGIRLLGIPTVLDRVIQQAIAQILSPIFEEKFSDSSYGFRPNRNAKQAIAKCKQYIEEGYVWTVDIDIANYFDTVNHDKLIRLIWQTVKDGRVISLIRKYLNSGVMANGVIVETEQGTPQGGNLSPLLANIMLNELDRELEGRGLKFCRYADDINIYVKSQKAAERVMQSITKFIEDKLKLKVNKEKSTVDRPWKLKFLGFSFYCKKEGIGIRVHPKSVKKFKQKLKEITGRSNAMSMALKMLKLKKLITGWINYFGIADMRKLAQSLDEWLRRRIRMCYWKQWKKIKTRLDNLVKLGIDKAKAWEFANTRKNYWRIAGSPILQRTFTSEYLKKLGFQSIAERYSLVH
ncbi:MAG: group II intron reverse transcriptase/maturase [Candidatus Atribacteria bacterium]|nr:group II intron reverse transcriptase/maturase [Candidatus Atribacteria bacterium]